MKPVEIPIDGILDLHTFQPSEVASLLDEYLAACLRKKIFRLRIIHGKGTGVLRTRVHRSLDRHPKVASYRLAEAPEGGWGATIVHLFPGH
jgi:dsDNA-specific endonuclease/ATPase MutS2